MRNAFLVMTVVYAGCGPSVALEDFLGKYEGNTTMGGHPSIQRDGAQQMSVFRALAVDEVSFSEFLPLGSKAVACAFSGRIEEGQLVVAPRDSCGAVSPKTLDDCGLTLRLTGGTANLVGDSLTVSVSGEVKRTELKTAACPPATLGRFSLVFNGRRVP